MQTENATHDTTEDKPEPPVPPPPDVETLPGATFYDAHMHAFNLGHASLNSFLRRFPINSTVGRMLGKWGPIVLGILGVVITLIILGAIYLPMVTLVVGLCLLAALAFLLFRPGGWRDQNTEKVKRFKNLLSVMENNFPEYFMVIEDCFREKGAIDSEVMLYNDGLIIGNQCYGYKRYPRVVLTPMMMDFGYKGKKDEEIHYWEQSHKLIDNQAADLLKAIKAYANYIVEVPKKDDKKSEERRYRHLGPQYDNQKTSRILEIYPFLGINPQRSFYKPGDMKSVLERYFGEHKKYPVAREVLRDNMKVCEWTPEKVLHSPFIGVKLYPPLGFDPWPVKLRYHQAANFEVLTDEIYEYCQDKNIPITVHGSASGFVAVEEKWELSEFTRIDNWVTVLKKYPHLKLNIAHFPLDEKRHGRLNDIIDLMLTYPNVYSDIACRAVNLKYYNKLARLLKHRQDDKPDWLSRWLAKKMNSGKRTWLSQWLMKPLNNNERDWLSQRLMFGSDFPVVLPNIESYRGYVRLFAESGTEKGLMHLMCSVNPERFLFKPAVPDEAPWHENIEQKRLTEDDVSKKAKDKMEDKEDHRREQDTKSKARAKKKKAKLRAEYQAEQAKKKHQAAGKKTEIA